MSTTPTSNGHPNPSPENDSSTQVKSSHNVGVDEIDERILPEKFQLPLPNEENEYYGILWHAFYRPDGIRTEAKIIHREFALVLAQGLSPYYRDKAATLLGSDLQSWIELGTLRRTFYLWISKSKVHKGSKTYKVVRKCEEETTRLGRKLLQEYESLMNGDKSGNEMIARLRTELILDLSVGKELKLLVDGRGMVDGSRRLVKSRLEGWKWIDEQCAELELSGGVTALAHRPRLSKDLATPGSSATGNIIVETFSSFTVVEQSGEELSPPTRRLPSGQKGLNAMKHRSAGHTNTTSSNARKAGRKHTSTTRSGARTRARARAR